MSKSDDFEGSLVLEKLAEVGGVEAFLEAVDSEDLDRARRLMKRANLDAATIAQVLEKIANGED